MQPGNYKNFWDAKASTYSGALIAVDGSSDENTVLATGARSAQQVAAALDLKASDRVLELGCGVARIGLPLASRVAFWHGLDISANMVAVAKQRLSHLSNVAVDALERPRLPLPDASFDAAYCIAVFIHMDKEDFFIYLRELRRVLKPGGRVFFDHWNLAHPVGFKRFAYEMNFYDQHGDPGVRKDVARNQFTTPQEVEIYLREAGFTPTAILADTPWVQALAINGDEALAAPERLRIAEARAQIDYGQAWTRYFDWILPVVFEGVHPRGILALLQQESEGEVRAMFETWLRSAWQASPAHYGALDN